MIDMRMIIRIGFVLQDDIVFPHLIVKETLTYAALLRLPSTLSRQQKKERAMNIIIELGLERYVVDYYMTKINFTQNQDYQLPCCVSY